MFHLSAPQATLRLRFPIPDLRPERDPWAGQAVRAEQLRLELSEPQFHSELNSGPGPPAPTRLELTCSDLQGKSVQEIAEVAPRTGKEGFFYPRDTNVTLGSNGEEKERGNSETLSFLSPPGIYEDGEKPPVPCLRVSKALDPRSTKAKYFLPQ